MANYLIYGANGYTGGLIARAAVERGHRPVLAGRNPTEIASLAGSLGLPGRPFPLEAAALDRNLQGVTAVLHCAGPFAHTAAAMAQACVRQGVHYLDVTGEIPVFETLAASDAAAKQAGVMLMPGVGFDVVPTDCLAAHLRQRLPTATRLKLGFQITGSLSRGTANTMIENLNRGGAVRKQGKIRPVPACWKTRAVNFGRGPTMAMTIPWGDVSTAWYTTRIPDIEVYVAAPPLLRLFARLSRHLHWLFAWRPVQRWLKARVAAGPPGPSAAQRRHGQSMIWGEVRDERGCAMTSWLRGPEGYETTALTALAVVDRVLAGDVRPGFHTPAGLYGANFILGVPGFERFDA